MTFLAWYILIMFGFVMYCAIKEDQDYTFIGMAFFFLPLMVQQVLLLTR